MTWLFSKAFMDSASSPSSRVPVAEYSADTFSVGEPFAQWSVMPTPQGFWRNDKMMDVSRLSRFGPTLRLLTEAHGADLLTSYRAAFPARTYQSQEKALDSTASAPASGESLRGWFARFDRATFSWKTAQCSLLGDLELFSATWPRLGSMRSGRCYPRPTAERPICARGSGLWQTPVADDAVDRKVGKWNSRGEPKLSAQVMLMPTPTAQDNAQVAGQYKNPKSTTTLAGFVRMFPTATATATAGKGWSQNHNRAQTDDRLDYTIEREAHESGQLGRLNPEFCEWLMGWPIGWTALEPLAMDRFREWQRSHSPRSRIEAAA